MLNNDFHLLCSNLKDNWMVVFQYVLCNFSYMIIT